MLLKRYIKQYPNVLSLETTSVLTRYASSLKYESAKIGSGEIVNEKIRKVGIHHITPTNKSLTAAHWANYLNYKITHLMNYYLYENNLQKFWNIGSINQCDFLKYEESYHYDFHVDENQFSQRILSAIIFLNNDYEGGSLAFKNTFDDDELEIKPIPGSFVIWPSNMLFPHSVQPVKKGIRYTVVAWGS